MSDVVVLKFGSSVLRTENDLPKAVHEIYRHWREGSKVMAVVSAIGNTTDRLLGAAATISAEPPPCLVAALAATGETTAAALLGMSLHRAGIPTKVLDPVQAGLRTIGDELDAEPVAIDRARLRAELQHSVIVLPGFAGRNRGGDTTLLGRGGSDLSAVFVANQLGARCILLKDVDGLYTSDPARVEAGQPLRFSHIKYETALRVGGTVVQAKAVRLAAECNMPFEITSVGASTGTEIGSAVDLVASRESSPTCLKVALLGCGTVGGGVYERLLTLPELFEITGVAVRDISRLRKPRVLEHLLTVNPEGLISKPCDVVVELIGGVERASALVDCALRSRRHVVTANKALLAAEGDRLQALANASEVRISGSAAVGGVLPALETIEQAKTLGPIRGFCGVLNGTTNFILDQLANEQEFENAILAAQVAGYAEADPALDLDGTDAAQKLILLARAAFGVSLSLASISRQGIEHLNSESLAGARKRGNAIRLVASCRAPDVGLQACVAPVELPFDHPLARLKSAQNGLIVETANGAQRIAFGTGSGRWPTTEALMADLLDLHRELSAAKSTSPELREEVA